MAILYGGLAKGESVKEMHRRLYEETINSKAPKEGAGMLRASLALASSLKRKIDADAVIGETLGDIVFALMRKKGVEKRLSGEMRKSLNETEGKAKERAISEALRKGKEDAGSLRIFYLCSSHSDCAEDHREWQGKLYIDERWETFPMGAETKREIRDFVNRKRIRTFQWVTSKPVWLITRPNCRHYFRQVSAREAMSKSIDSLLDEGDMRKPIGDRQYMQTIDHPKSKEWYEDVRNAELLLESYKERLKTHMAMLREAPCRSLRDAISKDRLLIAKWERYLSERKREK